MDYRINSSPCASDATQSKQRAANKIRDSSSVTENRKALKRQRFRKIMNLIEECDRE